MVFPRYSIVGLSLKQNIILPWFPMISNISPEVFENMNARLVSQAEREKKEKEKAAHEVKVERDRNNREAQKQKGLDRKEKEKKRTQKHERRR